MCLQHVRPSRPSAQLTNKKHQNFTNMTSTFRTTAERSSNFLIVGLYEDLGLIPIDISWFSWQFRSHAASSPLSTHTDTKPPDDNNSVWFEHNQTTCQIPAAIRATLNTKGPQFTDTKTKTTIKSNVADSFQRIITISQPNPTSTLMLLTYLCTSF
jgi:hypothetical protein